jgi:hypothetical protein
MGVMEHVLEQLKEINQKLNDLPAERAQNVELMNVEQAAEFLTLSETKVREEMRQGNIPCINYGRRQVIPKWELIEKINGEIESKEAERKEKEEFHLHQIG